MPVARCMSALSSTMPCYLLPVFALFLVLYRRCSLTRKLDTSRIPPSTTQEVKLLKHKLVDAGPEVVMKISEDRDKADSRLRAASRRVSELEGVVRDMQRQLDQVAEENIKVTAFGAFRATTSQAATTRRFVIFKLHWQ